MVTPRVAAAQAYVLALRTGEGSAADRAAPCLAAGVVLLDGKAEYRGRDQVLRRITGWWPFTAKYRRGAWSEPVEAGETVTIRAELPPTGAGPASLELRFEFDAEDRIRQVDMTGVPAPGQTTDVISRLRESPGGPGAHEQCAADRCLYR